MTYAHYITDAKGSYLYIYSTPKPAPGALLDIYYIDGKRAARKLVKEIGATPWNF
jgi:hypothetical protein